MVFLSVQTATCSPRLPKRGRPFPRGWPGRRIVTNAPGVSVDDEIALSITRGLLLFVFLAGHGDAGAWLIEGDGILGQLSLTLRLLGSLGGLVLLHFRVQLGDAALDARLSGIVESRRVSAMLFGGWIIARRGRLALQAVGLA